VADDDDVDDDDVDDDAVDLASLFHSPQGAQDDRATQPVARFSAAREGELKGEALQDFAMDCHRRAQARADDATAAKKAKAPAISQWLRAFGLASNDPANLDEYAIEAGLVPETLREALAKEEGAKLGIAAEIQLRNSGALTDVTFARMMHKAVAAVEKGLDDGSVSPATATKIIDEYGKFRERAIAAAVAAPTLFTGTAAQLVAEILDSNKPIPQPKLPWLV
jgi:hypothetical protein